MEASRKELQREESVRREALEQQFAMQQERLAMTYRDEAEKKAMSGASGDEVMLHASQSVRECASSSDLHANGSNGSMHKQAGGAGGEDDDEEEEAASGVEHDVMCMQPNTSTASLSVYVCHPLQQHQLH